MREEIRKTLLSVAEYYVQLDGIIIVKTKVGNILSYNEDTGIRVLTIGDFQKLAEIYYEFAKARIDLEIARLN